MPEYNKDSYLEKIREITKKLNEKEQELMKANRRLTSLLEHSPLGMMITVNRVIMYANERMHTLTGYDKKELECQNTRILYGSEKEYDRIGELIHNNKEFETAVVWKKKDGRLENYRLKFTKGENENYVSIYIIRTGLP